MKVAVSFVGKQQVAGDSAHAQRQQLLRG